MLRRLLLALAALPALALLYVVLGLGLGAIPVGGRDDGDGPVEIFIVSNGYHASLVLPLRAHGIDWTERHPPEHFVRPAPGASHIWFGWGERDFYMETRTLADLRIGTALGALFADKETVMHVALWMDPAHGADARRIMASRAQHLKLTEFVRAAFAGPELQLYHGRGYGPHDAFYAAVGRYSAIATCNEWTSRALRYAGIRTGLWTPFAHSILWHRDG
ncbi:MAG: TIGR02117 family protein [Alphaproteobacteria bacterium]|nr:TIGR02117 family protein [Alphaproteobacteria bacterium]